MTLKFPISDIVLCYIKSVQFNNHSLIVIHLSNTIPIVPFQV